MVIIGVMSILLDPFYLYIPNAKGPKFLGIDFDHAGVYFSIFRTLLDSFHLLHMIMQFRVAIHAPVPKIFTKSRKLIEDPRLIAIKYLKSWFFVNLISILPFPQIILWSNSAEVSRTLSMIVTTQFAPRMITMVPLNTKFSDALGIVVKNVWSGAIYNLFIFILIGHYIGAIYYLNYMVKLDLCLYVVFDKEMNDVQPFRHDCSQVHKECIKNYIELGQGMLSDAFANEIGLKSFVQKSIYCFVWGVRSLSSLGQIFDTSFDEWETSFSCIIMISGLVLLADLIAHMQTSVQSAGARREKQRIKQRRLEEWTHYHHLPHDLKRLVRKSVQSEWQCTKGIDDEAILNSLPLDLRRDIRTHLYQERVRNIPPFTRMDKQLVDFICGHLRPFTGAEGTYIVLQGDPLDKVVFIFNGKLQLTHHSNSHANSRSLEAGDFFGDDLLTWASQPNSSTQDLPPSYFTVKCISNVEAFCLHAEDVRLLVIFNYIQKFHFALRKHHA